MNLKLLLAILLLCLLPGCAHFTPAGSKGSDSPETDLDALASNAKRDLAPRTLPNGKLYCAEDSTTQKAQDQCTGDLEDALTASETDKAVGLADIIKAVERIKLRLNPCGWFSRTLFHRDRCKSPP